jgi:hypothetical protein
MSPKTGLSIFLGIYVAGFIVSKVYPESGGVILTATVCIGFIFNLLFLGRESK